MLEHDTLFLAVRQLSVSENANLHLHVSSCQEKMYGLVKK